MIFKIKKKYIFLKNIFKFLNGFEQKKMVFL